MNRFARQWGIALCCVALAIGMPNHCLATPVDATKDSITVYIFLSETCPICQTLTLEMKKVYEAYHDKGIAFVGLFPNQITSDKGTIRKFGKKYNIPFELRLDEKQAMANRLAATVTPQVFIVRNTDGKVFYKGLADNHFASLGKRRETATEHYLQNALDNILHNQPPNPLETEAVGCFIQKEKPQ